MIWGLWKQMFTSYRYSDKVATRECKTMDHTISLVGKASGQKFLDDNQKEFSTVAIAGRMEDFKFLLIFVKAIIIQNFPLIPLFYS